MKRVAITSLFTALVFSLIFPTVIALKNPIVAEEPSLYYSAGLLSDSSIPVALLNGDEVISMTMTDYLIGAVAAEMPASFDTEALKAQAVALRTYALYKMIVTPEIHGDADICSDSSCCAAWKDTDYLREKWGEDYDMYLSKITEAISATDGIYISYDDEPALAVFHSSSAGQTEESSAVWGTSLPYLISVDSPETAEDVPNYITSVTMSTEEFSQSFPTGDFSENPSDWITDTAYDSSGRLSTANIGGVTVTGTELRAMFSLRSTAITFEVTDSDVTITSTGYGHGVGMSQYGANVLAHDGYTYEEILQNYYPGTSLRETSGLIISKTSS